MSIQSFRNVQKLGISVDEQKMMNNVAMDIVVDSVSVATTFKSR
jgi:Fe-S cluster assembly protein SufB